MTAVSHFFFVGTCVGNPKAKSTIDKDGNQIIVVSFIVANKQATINCFAKGIVAKKCLIQCIQDNVVSVDGTIHGRYPKLFLSVEDMTQIYRGKPLDLSPAEKIQQTYDPKIIMKGNNKDEN